jgi:poly-gamma-glutamate system protein
MRAKIEDRWMLVFAVGAAAIWLAVDRLRWVPGDPLFEAKVVAGRTMEAGIAVLREERERRGLAWDAIGDPNRTGLIGREYTDLTTTLGSLGAKRTATNPNMAGLVVELLDRAGARPGEAIAVAFSGSFPAMNLAVLAAARALGLRAVVISSVGASSYGANEAEWTWLDMERVLVERGVSRHRSVFSALGGIVDEGGGLDGTGLAAGGAAIRRSGVSLLDEGGRATLEHDVLRRMRIYREGCGGKPSVFVNVGGVLTSLGGEGEAQVFAAGVIRPGARGGNHRRGVMARMIEEGVPVVHLLDLRRLAARYGLPFDPVPLPGVPDGAVMRPRRFGQELAGGGLVALGLLGFALTRMRRKSPVPPSPGSSQPMSCFVIRSDHKTGHRGKRA